MANVYLGTLLVHSCSYNSAWCIASVYEVKALFGEPAFIEVDGQRSRLSRSLPFRSIVENIAFQCSETLICEAVLNPLMHGVRISVRESALHSLTNLGVSFSWSKAERLVTSLRKGARELGVWIYEPTFFLGNQSKLLGKRLRDETFLNDVHRVSHLGYKVPSNSLRISGWMEIGFLNSPHPNTISNSIKFKGHLYYASRGCSHRTALSKIILKKNYSGNLTKGILIIASDSDDATSWAKKLKGIGVSIDLVTKDNVSDIDIYPFEVTIVCRDVFKQWHEEEASDIKTVIETSSRQITNGVLMLQNLSSRGFPCRRPLFSRTWSKMLYSVCLWKNPHDSESVKLASRLSAYSNLVVIRTVAKTSVAPSLNHYFSLLCISSSTIPADLVPAILLNGANVTVINKRFRHTLPISKTYVQRQSSFYQIEHEKIAGLYPSVLKVSQGDFAQAVSNLHPLHTALHLKSSITRSFAINTAFLKSLKPPLVCTICMTAICDWISHCGHGICLQCVEQLFKSSPLIQGIRVAPCPTCRTPVTVGDGTIVDTCLKPRQILSIMDEVRTQCLNIVEKKARVAVLKSWRNVAPVLVNVREFSVDELKITKIRDLEKYTHWIITDEDFLNSLSVNHVFKTIEYRRPKAKGPIFQVIIRS